MANVSVWAPEGSSVEPHTGNPARQAILWSNLGNQQTILESADFENAGNILTWVVAWGNNGMFGAPPVGMAGGGTGLHLELRDENGLNEQDNGFITFASYGGYRLDMHAYAINDGAGGAAPNADVQFALCSGASVAGVDFQERITTNTVTLTAHGASAPYQSDSLQLLQILYIIMFNPGYELGDSAYTYRARTENQGANARVRMWDESHITVRRICAGATGA